MIITIEEGSKEERKKLKELLYKQYTNFCDFDGLIETENRIIIEIR